MNLHTNHGPNVPDPYPHPGGPNPEPDPLPDHAPPDPKPFPQYEDTPPVQPVA